MSRAETPAALGQTLGSAVQDATDVLKRARSPSARLDAEVLVSWAMERDRAWLLAHLDGGLPSEASSVLSAAVARRAGGEPIAYIRGFKEWYGIRMATDRRALIPRPETELLVDAAIAELADRLVRDDAKVLVADLGTGSGAIAVALGRRFHAALALGRMRLVASDASPEAIELAADNLAAHGVAHLVTLAVGDLLEPMAGQPAPDVVVANLPYVQTAEVDAGPGSLAWEPASALDGGRDGLDVVRRLLAQLPSRLVTQGTVLLEVGAGQAEAVRTAASELPGAWAVSTLADLAGIDRIIRLERRS